MRAYVRFRLDRGEVRDLGPGDVIGRMWTAALQISDPFVSEAHALVSLREGALKLLGLRGRLSVAGRQVNEVSLSVGLDIALSPRTQLHVVEVSLPTVLLALEHPDLGRRILSGVVSLVAQPRLDLVPGAILDALAVVWSDGLAWFARLRDGGELVLAPDSDLVVEGVTLRVVPVAIGTSGEITTVDPHRADNALHLSVRYDTVHIHRDGAATLTIDGIAARILSDLATAGVPMGWQMLAREMWPGEDDLGVMRRNWDAALSRLRKKLRDAGVRADLVRADRSGNFELFLMRGDRVEDQT